ncbi:aminotransferase class I/II-fold pyridoxal phosphate-dependent enzyme [Streptomyces sp. M19]
MLRRDELAALAEVVVERDLLVISDEVHAELTHEGATHIPFASLSAEVAARTVTVTSGSKAFNLAGARCAVAHIGVKALRDAVDDHRGLLFGQVGALGVEALGPRGARGSVVGGVREVLARNRRRLAEELPEGIGFVPPDATYLAWLDCRALGVGDDPSAFFQEHGKLMLFRGADFGAEGRASPG